MMNIPLLAEIQGGEGVASVNGRHFQAFLLSECRDVSKL
jgi:hypothetical protein